VALRDRLTTDVSHLTDEALRTRGGDDLPGSSGGSDMADLGSDNYEHEFTLSLLENQEQTLEEIDEALKRIEQGKFGWCEECREAIPKPRLRALPYTRHCVDCARKLQ